MITENQKLAKQDSQIIQLSHLIETPKSLVRAAFKIADDIEIDEAKLPALVYDLYMRVTSIAKVKTIGQIFQQKSPPLIVWAKEKGEENIIQMLEYFIASTNQYFDFNSKMSIANSRQTAELIFSTYFQLTITDILFVFRNARLGKYGEVIGLNGGKILTWFDRHFDERCQVAVTETLMEHHNATFDVFERSGQDQKVSQIRDQIRAANKQTIHQKPTA